MTYVLIYYSPVQQWWVFANFATRRSRLCRHLGDRISRHPQGWFADRARERKGDTASARVVRSWRQVEGYAPLPLSSRPARDSSYPAWRPVAVGLAIAAVADTITQSRRQNFATTMEGSAGVTPWFFCRLNENWCRTRLWWFILFICRSPRTIFFKKKKIICAWL